MVRQSMWFVRAAFLLIVSLSILSIAEGQSSFRPLSNENVSEPSSLQGQLLLCGGGDLPFDLLSAFYSCGRGERLVVIPTASNLSEMGDFTRWRQAWADFNWRSVDIVHASSREQAEEESLADVLSKATAVWISGGDQSRLADRYLGSRVEKEIRGVMKRGGIVGGTSAGSAVVTKIMITGGQSQPRMNQGLDLLPKAIVDQHFSQRKRQDRLANAVAIHPDRIGIGIDEGTGLYINSKEARVLGNGAVHVFKSQRQEVRQEEESKETLVNYIQKVNFVQKRFSADTSIAIDDLPLLCE